MQFRIAKSRDAYLSYIQQEIRERQIYGVDLRSAHSSQISMFIVAMSITLYNLVCFDIWTLAGH